MNTLTYMFIIITLYIPCWEVDAWTTKESPRNSSEGTSAYTSSQGTDTQKTASTPTTQTPFTNGIYISTTAEALQDFAISLINTLPSNCTNFKGHHGIVSLDPFGQVYFMLDKIKLLEKIGGSVNVTVVDGVGLKVVLKNVNVKISANWYYRYKKFFIDVDDLGKGVLKALDLEMTFILRILKSPQGSFNFTAKECVGSFRDLDLNAGGGLLSFVYSPITKLVSYMLSNPCRMLGLGLEQASLMSLKFPLMDLVKADLSLTRAPVFRNGSVGLFLKGEFVGINSTTKPDFRPGVLNHSTEDRLLNLQISKASLLSFIQALMNDGSFRKVISKDDFPEPLHKHFSASCWFPSCIGFPFIQLKFGYSGYYINIAIELSTLPRLALKEEGAYVQIRDLRVSLNASNGAENIRLVTFLFTSTLLANFYVSENSLVHWKLEKKSLYVVDTIGHMGLVPDVSSLTNLALDHFVIPEVNRLGGEGRLLTLEACMRLLNSTLGVKRGRIQAGSDLKMGE